MHGENLRKFTETRATAPRARHEFLIYQEDSKSDLAAPRSERFNFSFCAVDLLYYAKTYTTLVLITWYWLEVRIRNSRAPEHSGARVPSLDPGRVNCQTCARASRARNACIIFFSKIYEIPRTRAARALCASSLPLNSTVNLEILSVYTLNLVRRSKFRIFEHSSVCTHAKFST